MEAKVQEREVNLFMATMNHLLCGAGSFQGLQVSNEDAGTTETNSGQASSA